MSDPLLKELRALTRAIQEQAQEQRETNLLLREMLDLEPDGEQADPEEAQALSPQPGRIVRKRH